MPSQFSAVGFSVSTGEDLAALATHVAERADTIDAEAGQYLKWAPRSGEQLWLQVKHSGDAMGMNPHFEGLSSVPLVLDARVVRQAHTPLDGTFLAWANTAEGGGREYPLAFDCPDAALHQHLAFPAAVTAQIAAFAQQITVYPSERAYQAAQAAQGLTFTSRAFIPSGLIAPSGEAVVPPESHALITGHALDAHERRNAVTGNPFWWVLLETVGGTYDVVVDPELLSGPVEPGHVVSGWFWLSGRLRPAQAPRAGWLHRLTGRG